MTSIELLRSRVSIRHSSPPSGDRISTTTRPFTLPATMSAATCGTSSRLTWVVSAWSFERSRSWTSRSHTLRRRGMGVETELMPTSLTPAQDEGRHVGGQVHALRIAAGGDGAFRVHLRDDVGERHRTDGIDSTRPARLGERLHRAVELVAVDHARGTQALEERLFRDAARGGDDPVAELGEDHDGRRADTARGTRHQNVAVGGLHALLFQRHDAEHGGVACNAHRHAVGRRPALRHRNEPVAADARHFREAAMVAFAHAIAVEHHLVARLPARMRGTPHHAGEIDAGDQRKAPRDRGLARDVEAILVVHRGMRDVHRDVALHQVASSSRVKIGLLAGIGLGDENGAE
jgi:hypothetical protein